MDIQINAAQGRGKSTLARAIARTFGGIIADLDPSARGSIINLSDIVRQILDARADVVILDDLQDWHVGHVAEAVQKARVQLNRNIVAIYCVQDHNVGISARSACIPEGFINPHDQTYIVDDISEGNAVAVRAVARLDRYAAGPQTLSQIQTPTEEQAKELHDKWREAATLGQRVHDEVVVGLKDNPLGSVKSYTSDILMDMARTIRTYGDEAERVALDNVCKHFGVEGVACITPVFYATAHEHILPIWQRTIDALRDKCREILNRGYNQGAARKKALRAIVYSFGSNRVGGTLAEHVPALFEALKDYGTK